MKKLSFLAASSALFFVACGGSSATDPDDVSSSNSSANETDFSAEACYSVEAYESLPACNDKKEGQTGYVTGTLTDSRDGQKYKTTKIGEQVWMAENLNYAYLQPTDELDSSSFCYDNDPAMCKKYGRLYLWSAAMDSAGVLKNDGKGKGCGYGAECGVEGPIQGICPKGWHLPSGDEFDKLLVNVGASWKEQSVNLIANSWVDGKDEYGFSALPAGYYGSYGKRFYDLGYDAYFWSSTEYDSYGAYYLYLYDGRTGVNGSGQDNGRSVRCLQDN